MQKANNYSQQDHLPGKDEEEKNPLARTVIPFASLDQLLISCIDMVNSRLGLLMQPVSLLSLDLEMFLNSRVQRRQLNHRCLQLPILTFAHRYKENMVRQSDMELEAKKYGDAR